MSVEVLVELFRKSTIFQNFSPQTENEYTSTYFHLNKNPQNSTTNGELLKYQSISLQST